MPAKTKPAASSKGPTATIGFEAKLWLTADKLRNIMVAAEYKHVVLGLLFLSRAERDRSRGSVTRRASRGQRVKYISDTFEEHRAKLLAIERDNPRLKGVLPKDYARPGLDKQHLGELIDVIATIELTAASEDEKTRRSVEMLAPYKGRIHDPACGPGGMFFQSIKFVEAHGDKIGDISIYSQDKWARRQRPFGLATRARRERLRRQQPKQSNATTRRLAVMNLALRGIEADFGPEHADTFRRDLHPDLRADYVLANPAVRKANNPEMAQPRLK